MNAAQIVKIREGQTNRTVAIPKAIDDPALTYYTVTRQPGGILIYAPVRIE